MSELREFECRIYWPVEQGVDEVNDIDLFYLKSEADKVIAEKDKEIADKDAEILRMTEDWNRLCEKYNKFIKLKQEFCEKFKDIELEITK